MRLHTAVSVTQKQCLSSQKVLFFFHLAQLSCHLRMWYGCLESMSKECEITHVWRTLKEVTLDIISRHVQQDALLSHPHQNPHSLGVEERCGRSWTSTTGILAGLSLISATFLITCPSFATASLINTPPDTSSKKRHHVLCRRNFPITE